MVHYNRRHQSWLIAAVACVFFWRVAALQWPSSFVQIPDGLRAPLTLMGFLFLLCGVVAWWLHPDRRTGVFLLYCVGGGVHWGGAIGSHIPEVELGLFFIYLALTAIGDASLLRLALIFPSRSALSSRWKTALYAPAALALIWVPIAGFVTQNVNEALAGLVLLVANLFSITAGVLFLVHLFRADPVTRRQTHLPLIATSLVVASVLALIGAGGVLPGHPEAWNFCLALIPISLAFALVSSERLEQPS